MLQLFLTIVGAVLIAVVVLVVGLIVALKIVQWRLKRAISGFGEALKGLATAMPPARVHLSCAEGPLTWSDRTAVTRATGALQAIGFEQIGEFTADEINDMPMRALMDRQRSLYAVVYEHPAAGVWVDVVLAYEDGGSVTVANTGEGAGLDRPPEHPIVRLPGATSEQLVERIERERDPTKPARPVSADDFAPFFERAYAEMMDWRLARGFASADEVRAVMRNKGDDADIGAAGLTAMLMAQHANAQLAEVIRERFAKETDMPVARWEQVRDRLVVVHDRLSRSDVTDLLGLPDEDDSDDNDATAMIDTDADDEPEDIPSGLSRDDIVRARAAVPADATARQYFAAANDALPASHHHAKLGEVTQPVPADVYEAPTDRD